MLASPPASSLGWGRCTGCVSGDAAVVRDKIYKRHVCALSTVSCGDGGCRFSRPVERRGREIGALFSRGILNPESNLCYGEGGAGTWSDGKLTTRIGRNSDAVRKVCVLFCFFFW